MECTGPNINDCTKCFPENMLSKSETSRGQCIQIYCPEKQYYDQNENKCKKCHETCKKCVGPLRTECIDCGKLIPEMQENGLLLCKTCIELNLGYFTDLNGNCIGILIC